MKTIEKRNFPIFWIVSKYWILLIAIILNFYWRSGSLFFHFLSLFWLPRPQCESNEIRVKAPIEYSLVISHQLTSMFIFHAITRLFSTFFIWIFILKLFTHLILQLIGTTCGYFWAELFQSLVHITNSCDKAGTIANELPIVEQIPVSH